MKIRMIEAAQFFDHGGYIDLKTGQYIVSKSFAEKIVTLAKMIPENDTEKMEKLKRSIGMIASPSEYKAIEAAADAFLQPPVIRNTGIDCAAAVLLGVSREQLVSMGYINESKWALFYEGENRNTFQWVPNEEDERASHALSAYMRETGQYRKYVETWQSVRSRVISEWLLLHGIEVC